MKHFTHIADLGPEGVQEVQDQAVAWKANAPGQHLAGRILGMVFFNPSLRTRTSFEAAMIRGGGNAIVLEVGNGVWRLESRDGVIMDGDLTEHLREAVPVLGRYTDFLAVRAFSDGGGLAADDADHVINAFRRFAGVPVISMESAREHPCQGLADMLTVRENFGDLQNLPVTLTWAPHIKRLPRAVPNSFLLSAAASGCDVRVVHPEGFELAPSVLEQAHEYARATGGKVSVLRDRAEAAAGSKVLYAKAWGPTEGTAEVRLDDWMTRDSDFDMMHRDAIFCHCLPVRRNLEVSETVLDGPRSRVIDEAENRFHVQRVILDRLKGGA